MRIQAVLFDLDGTLLDTASDLGFALNQVLQTQGLPPLPLATIRTIASHGVKGLLKLGFNIDEQHLAYTELREQLLAHYQANLANSTQLFPGMAKVLAQLEWQNIPWGIVTNKPSWLTEPLLSQLQLANRAACIVSGDTVPRPKPAPDPLLYAAKQINCNPSQCLYIGDAERDIIASKAAGMFAILANYGYLGPNDTPSTWGADAEITSPIELLNWLPALPTKQPAEIS